MKRLEYDTNHIPIIVVLNPLPSRSGKQSYGELSDLASV